MGPHAISGPISEDVLSETGGLRHPKKLQACVG